MNRIILFVLLFMTFVLTDASTQDYTFVHIGLKDGLSDCRVTNIMEDSKGFIWISTQNGLNRFDGYNMKRYAHNSKDEHSLPNNYVRYISEDEEGMLWIQIPWHMFVCFDPRKEIFEPAQKVLSEKYGINLSPNFVRVDKEKNIWTANDNGLNLYNPRTKRLSLIPANPEKRRQGIYIHYIAEYGEGVVAVYNDGSFDMVNRDRAAVSVHEDMLSLSNKDNVQYQAYCDIDDKIWFYGDGKGVKIFDPKQNLWTTIDNGANSPIVLTSLDVTDIKEDALGNIWVATDHGGINIIEKKSGDNTVLTRQNGRGHGLAHNSLTCLYRDKSGGIWAGYHKHGLSYHNDNIYRFNNDEIPVFRADDFTPDINAFAEDDRGNLWIGTSEGLVYIDKISGQRKLYKHRAGTNSLSGDVITSLL